MATFPRTTTSGGTGTTTPAAPVAPRIITAAGTAAILAGTTAVIIDPTVAGVVALTLAADYPLGERLLVVDARPGPREVDITPLGTPAAILGDPLLTLVNDSEGWVSIWLVRSALGWAVA